MWNEIETDWRHFSNLYLFNFGVTFSLCFIFLADGMVNGVVCCCYYTYTSKFDMSGGVSHSLIVLSYYLNCSCSCTTLKPVCSFSSDIILSTKLQLTRYYLIFRLFSVNPRVEKHITVSEIFTQACLTTVTMSHLKPLSFLILCSASQDAQMQ